MSVSGSALGKDLLPPQTFSAFLLLEDILAPLQHWVSLVWRELLPWTWDALSAFTDPSKAAFDFLEAVPVCIVKSESNWYTFILFPFFFFCFKV